MRRKVKRSEEEEDEEYEHLGFEQLPAQA